MQGLIVGINMGNRILLPIYDFNRTQVVVRLKDNCNIPLTHEYYGKLPYNIWLPPGFFNSPNPPNPPHTNNAHNPIIHNPNNPHNSHEICSSSNPHIPQHLPIPHYPQNFRSLHDDFNSANP